jgi:hypothetical protein
MRRTGRRDPSTRIQPAQFKLVASLARQLREVLSLGSSIALTKRVNMVDVTDDPTRFKGERRRAQATKEALAGQPSPYIRHTGLDKAPEQEVIPAFGDLDSADLPGPREHVLK